MRYEVNASVWFPAWLEVESDSPEEALAEAKGYSARDFERDESSGQVEFDVQPQVTEAA
jgi:hypothetical protein